MASLRIPWYEASILALGRVKFAPLVAHEADEKARKHMLEAEVLLTYRKDLSNLSLQHSRLTRHRLRIAKDTAPPILKKSTPPNWPKERQPNPPL